MLLALTLDALDALDNIGGLTEPAPLSISALLLNLVLGATCAYLLSWHYVRFGKTNSNRAELAQVFPIIAMTTVLIISVVKSSLALSLGLVGALSIVRFRTPIKEPEELGYLFISISLGLGFGADQRVPTLLAVAFILFVLATFRQIPGKLKPSKHTVYCNIELPAKGEDQQALQQIHSLLSVHTQLVDMRRMDVRDGWIHATYLIHCQDDLLLLALMDSLQQTLPDAAVSFIDQKGPLGI
jgi:uncharacterized membrane protein YhiD involved in acid resistance